MQNMDIKTVNYEKTDHDMDYSTAGDTHNIAGRQLYTAMEESE